MGVRRYDEQSNPQQEDSSAIPTRKETTKKRKLKYDLYHSKFQWDGSNREVLAAANDSHNVKKGEFDKNIFNEQKKSLLNDYEEQIKTNSFWINSIVKANKYNESIERIFYIDKVINQITFADIKKLAKKYFDDTYFETLQLLEE